MQGQHKTNKVVVIIEMYGTSHRVATAYSLPRDRFDKEAEDMELIWEKS